MEESEQVQVSANKLQLLIEKQRQEKEENAKNVARLEARIKACEMEKHAYEDALRKASLMKTSKAKHVSDNSKIAEEIEKAKKFDEWYEKNKCKLIEEEYTKNYENDVNKLKERLVRMFE
jgi:membrane protein involved in colicin uptake